jgi:hypothetical protein
LAQSRGCLDRNATAADTPGEGGEGRLGEGETQRGSKNGRRAAGWSSWMDGKLDVEKWTCESVMPRIEKDLI